MARALVLEPKLLLADEPTGNLDTHTGAEIHDLFFELNREHGTTMLIVTHNPELAGRMPRRVNMVDGSTHRRSASRRAGSPEPARAHARSRPRWRSLELVGLALCRRTAPPQRSGVAALPASADGRRRRRPARNAWADLKDAKIDKIQFRGNRKVEDDAIRVNLISSVGTTLERDKLREDVRSLWKMNFFEDVHVEATRATAGGVALTFVFVEKPSIRKILVQGNEELGLDKINEAIDLKRDTILDVPKIKKNIEKVKDLYVSKGYYLANVDYQVRPVNESEVDVWLVIQENSKVQIRKVSFTGNVAASDDDLKRIMSTQEGGLFSFISDSGTYQEDAFERDLSLLTAYYYDLGYVNVKISAPHVTLSADKRYMYIDIPIDEGPPFDIGKIDFKGDLLVTRDLMYRLMETKENQRFSRSKLGKDLVHINDLYKDAGYAYVNVSPQTIPNLDKKTIDVTFEIEKGSKVYFERINIRGNTKTRDKVIRREMKIVEGDLYNQTALDVSKNRVTALGFFEKVDISTKRGSTDEFIEVNVEVQEKSTGTFQIGAGFSSVESFIAQAQIAQNNLFGRGQVMSLQAQLSGLRQIFSLRFIEPYFFDSNWTFAIDVYNQTIAQITFARNSTGGDLTWGYPLSYYARLFVTYKAEEVGVNTGTSSLILSGGVVSPVNQNAVANLFRGGFPSSVRAALTWDSRNNRLFPSSGYYHNVFIEIADNWTGSENVFVRWGGLSRVTTSRSGGRSS